MQGHISARARAVRMAALLTLAIAALLVVATRAAATAPVMQSVDLPLYEDHPTFHWSLPTGSSGQIWSDHIVTSKTSDVHPKTDYLAGEFLERNWVAFATLGHTDVSYGDQREYKPGTYFVHVAGHDPSCPSGTFECQIEFSNILSFDVVAPPPPPKPGGGGGTTDTVAPLQTLSFSAVQDIDKLRVTTRASEAGTATATGTVAVPGASKVYRFKRASRSVAANAKTTLRLKLAKKRLRAVKRALKRHKRLKAKLTLTVADKAGNKRAAKVTIGLRD